MADYIDRQEAINLFSWFLEQGEYIPPEYLVQKLMELTAKKAREDVHGKWKKEVVRQPFVHVLYKCSECGCIRDLSSDFCPACGADMREDEKE